MIGFLRGVVLEVDEDQAVTLDVQGVGYRVHVGARLHGGLVPGEHLALYVHTHVREDTLALYGVATPEERRLFGVLLSAHGVGPSLAMAILDQLGGDGLARAIATEDADALCAVSGIGKKTASRMVIDLAPRFGDAVAIPSTIASLEGSARQEARLALLELGYSSDEVQRALSQVGELDGVEELLRASLKELAR